MSPGDKVRHKGRDFFVVHAHLGFLIAFRRAETADQINLDVLAFRQGDCELVASGAEPAADCRQVWEKLPAKARSSLLAMIRREASKSAT